MARPVQNPRPSRRPSRGATPFHPHPEPLETVDANSQRNPELSAAERKRALRILAKSIYRELSSQGYDERQIVSLAAELISEVTQRIGGSRG